jgi:hypothetical protein
MEQQAPLHREYAEGEYQMLPDQDFCQILSIFSRVYHNNPTHQSRVAEIFPQNAQIAAEDLSAPGAEPPAQLRRKSGLGGQEGNRNIRMPRRRERPV